jgi:hypothetical protein
MVIDDSIVAIGADLSTGFISVGRWELRSESGDGKRVRPSEKRN